LNGHKTHRLANTTNITFHGVESEALLILLDQESVCASSGSACLADSDEPSHVVKAMKPESTAFPSDDSVFVGCRGHSGGNQDGCGGGEKDHGDAVGLNAALYCGRY
jgi:hypothetical protein